MRWKSRGLSAEATYAPAMTDERPPARLRLAEILLPALSGRQ
jgi:hypothetical protein